MNKPIILTDGVTVFARREVDHLKFRAEINRLNAEAIAATDGNLYWCEDRSGYQNDSPPYATDAATATGMYDHEGF